MVARILHQYNNAKQWETKNPILSPGEFGIESSTNLLKIGDGKTDWNDLKFSLGEECQIISKSYGYLPKISNHSFLRGQMVQAYTTFQEKRTDRMYMYLNKTLPNGETVCELFPLSELADIRIQAELEQEDEQ